MKKLTYNKVFIHIKKRKKDKLLMILNYFVNPQCHDPQLC